MFRLLQASVCRGALTQLECTVVHRSFHASNALLNRNKRRGRRGGRQRRRSKQKEENELQEWGAFEDGFEADGGVAETEGAGLSSRVSLESDWKLPEEITAALKEDPTYFHGREGLASFWTPPSSRLSDTMLDVFAKIRREQELKSLHEDDE